MERIVSTTDLTESASRRAYRDAATAMAPATHRATFLKLRTVWRNCTRWRPSRSRASCHSVTVTPSSSASTASSSSLVTLRASLSRMRAADSSISKNRDTAATGSPLPSHSDSNSETAPRGVVRHHRANATARRRSRPCSIGAPMAVRISSHSASPIPRSCRNSLCLSVSRPPANASNVSRCADPTTRHDSLTSVVSQIKQCVFHPMELHCPASG